MSNEKKMLYTILTVVLCVVGFLLVRHMVLQSQNKLSDRVAGTYTAEYDITYAVDEAIEGAYNVDINDGEDEVHFNAEIILAPDKTFTLSFDTNGFNEELLIYCAKLENDLDLALSYHVPGESRILVRTGRHQFHLVGGSVTACEHVFFAGHVAA